MDPQFRRALAYVAPYWRRLALVVVLSLASTAASLIVPLLSRDLIDDALLAGDRAVLVRIVALFIGLTLLGFLLNVASGLRYTRVSAEILFDMRLDLYRHLQRLSPRFYARTRLGDIVSRLNNDIGEIQRVAAEAALSWIGNLLFLAGSVGMMIWLDVRLFLAGIAVLPLSIWALVVYRRRLEGRVAAFRERSADIGSFLIETLSAMKLVVTANAQGREVTRFRDRNQAFIGALMAMQRVTYLAGGLPGVLLSGGLGAVFLYGGFRYLDGSLSMGTLVAFMAYQTRLMAPVQGLMGLYASLATAKVSLARVHEIADAPVDVEEVPGAAESHGGSRRGGVRWCELLVRPGRGNAGGRVVQRRTGRDGSHRRPQRGREVHRGRPPAALPGSGSGRGPAGRPRPAGRCRSRSCAGTWRWWSTRRSSSTPRWPRTSVTRGRRRATARWRRRRARPASRTSSRDCRRATGPSWASGGRRCRRGSGSASASPVRCSPIRACWCSTRRRPRSTRSRSGASSTATRRSCASGRRCSSRTASGSPGGRTASWRSTARALPRSGPPDELLERRGVFARLFESQVRPTDQREAEPHGAGAAVGLEGELPGRLGDARDADEAVSAPESGLAAERRETPRAPEAAPFR